MDLSYDFFNVDGMSALLDSLMEISSSDDGDGGDDDDESTNPPSEQLMNLSLNTITGIDRISNLPDSLLHHTLSFLPIKDTARSSILSKRWIHLWTWLPNLHLHQSQMNYQDFESIAFKILRSRRASFIKNFSLVCHFEYDTDFNSTSLCQLLSAVVERNVEEVYLYLFGCQDPFKLNVGVLSCKTLVVLKLSGEFVLRFGSSVKLPSLKALCLIDVRYEDADTIRNLVLGCPVLDGLYIKRCGFVRSDVTNYRVSSPSLTILVWEDVPDPNLELICLDVPAVKHLAIEFGGRPSVLVFKNTDNVVGVNISMENLNMEMDWRRVMKMFQPLHGALNLKFSINGYPNKESEYHIPSFRDFPRFENLVELELSSYRFTWRLILHMLYNCPQLQSLAFSKTPCIGTLFFPFFAPEKHEESVCEDPQCCWVPPQKISNCLDSQLTSFKFKGIEGTEGEMKLVQYVMQNAKVLRDVTIECRVLMELEQQSRILQELSGFERVSTTCQLKFE